MVPSAIYANNTNRHDVTGIVTNLKSSTNLNSTVATGGGEGLLSLVSLCNDLKNLDFVDSFFVIGSFIAFLRVVLFGVFVDLIEFEALSRGLCEEEDVPEIDVGCVTDLGGTNEDATTGFVCINTFSLAR